MKTYSVELQPREEDDYGRTYLVITDDKRIVKHIDGGEPEDNFYGRDWSWVAEELEAAYRAVLRDAKTIGV